MLTPEILAHFGLDPERDPFVWCEPYESADLREMRQRVKATVANRGWLAVVGIPGSGKSFGLRHVLAELDVHHAELLSGERSRTSAGLIDRCLLQAVGDEPPKASREARRAQMRRVLGEASRVRPILLEIDEATSVHSQVWTEVKLLRDVLRFGSDPRNPRRQDPRPLFSVLLVGWPGLAAAIQRSNELRPRISIFTLKGFSREEVHDYIAHLGLTRIAPKAVRDTIAERGARRPLLVNERLQIGMENAWYRGADKLSVEDVALDATDLFALARQLDIQQAEVVKATGLAKGTVSAVFNGRASSQRVQDIVRAKLEEIVALKQGRDDRVEAVA